MELIGKRQKKGGKSYREPDVTQLMMAVLEGYNSTQFKGVPKGKVDQWTLKSLRPAHSQSVAAGYECLGKKCNDNEL